MNKSSSSAKRLRVLMIAEAANPKLTSVALIGWHLSCALSEVCEGHLVSELRNKGDIEAALPANLKFTAVDNRRWQGFAWRFAKLLRGGTSLGWTTYSALSALVYPFYEKRVWAQFRHTISDYDLVHRLTPLSPVCPSLLARKCNEVGVPFLFGPVNGGVPWPKEFPGLRQAEREWLSPVRGAYKLMPGFHSTRKHATGIIVASAFAMKDMPEQYHSKCVYLPENAIEIERFPRRPVPSLSKPLGIAFVGRLVPLKGVDMLVEAVAPLIKQGKVRLDVIGDGPEMPRLRQMVSDLGITEGVLFPGWVDHSQMANRLGQSQVFGFPSIREFGGGVVLEAMALGLVPVVLKYGGPAELVDSSTGFALPMAPRGQVIQGLRDAFEKLASDPETTRKMGERAQENVYRNFTWEAKARQIELIYQWVAGFRKEKPDFGMPIQ